MTQKNLIEKYREVCLLLPSYRNVPSRTYYNMMNFLLKLTQLGFNPSLGMVQDTYAPMARNVLTEQFISMQGERRGFKKPEIKIVLWADADNNFTVQDFLSLLTSFSVLDLDICGARYLMRGNLKESVCAFRREEEGYRAVEKEGQGLQEVDGIGFGMLLMKAEVLEKLFLKHKKALFQTPYYNGWENGEFRGEDLFFCELAQKAGYSIWVNHEIKIGHEGGELRG